MQEAAEVSAAHRTLHLGDGAPAALGQDRGPKPHPCQEEVAKQTRRHLVDNAWGRRNGGTTKTGRAALQVHIAQGGVEGGGGVCRPVLPAQEVQPAPGALPRRQQGRQQSPETSRVNGLSLAVGPMLGLEAGRRGRQLAGLALDRCNEELLEGLPLPLPALVTEDVVHARVQPDKDARPWPLRVHLEQPVQLGAGDWTVELSRLHRQLHLPRNLGGALPRGDAKPSGASATWSR
mmetsp:Transcript_23346/g.72713  ORF Transcript_23346/g.72713 Transcript_23346/m.72713 type:complete len:234 (+) Transcript_23346:391-1092(+)